MRRRIQRSRAPCAAGHHFTIEAHLAGRRLDQSQHHAGHGAFARPRLANHAQRRATSNRERHAVHHQHRSRRRRIALRNRLHFQQSHARMLEHFRCSRKGVRAIPAHIEKQTGGDSGTPPAMHRAGLAVPTASGKPRWLARLSSQEIRLRHRLPIVRKSVGAMPERHAIHLLHHLEAGG